MIETQNYMMTRDETRVEFTGLAHDHLMASSKMQSARANALHHHHSSPIQQHQSSSMLLAQNGQPATFGCLNSIRDTTNIIQQQQQQQQQEQTDAKSSAASAPAGASAVSTIAILRRQTMYDSLVLVKKFRPCLNGYTLEFPTSYVDDTDESRGATICDNKSTENQDVGCGRTKLVSIYLDGDDPIYQNQNESTTTCNGFKMKPDGGDVVYVPVNGLIDRLNNYDRQGTSIDSRVYAFAMGLKTSERFLTSSSEKEIQEAPPL